MTETGGRRGYVEQKDVEPYLRDIGNWLIELSNGRRSEFALPTILRPRSSGLPGGESDEPMLARLAREEWSERSRRRKFIDFDVFGEPAWDILLDLYASRFDGRMISVTSSCIASNVPPTTALRWIGQLIDTGLIERKNDPADQRRAWVDLTQLGYNAMSRYLVQRAEARFNRPIQFSLSIPRKNRLDTHVTGD